MLLQSKSQWIIGKADTMRLDKVDSRFYARMRTS